MDADLPSNSYTIRWTRRADTEWRFGRYADDAVVRCVTERQASALVAARLGKDETRRAGCG